jgi:glycosyltransferase involved in cell wall biosynthesis
MSRISVASSKMRILVSGHLPPPMGGVAAFYETLLNSSLPERVDLKFVQTSSQKRSFETSGQVSLQNILAAIADCWRFARAVWSFRPQIAHISTAFGLSFAKHSICVLVARFFGSKVLLHPHCGFAAVYTDRPAAWQHFFRWVIGLVDGVAATSHEWNQLLSVMPDCQVFVLPNAIDLKTYQLVAQDRFASMRDGRSFHVLYLGYLGKAKGSFDLVDAARTALHDDHVWEFRLVGGELTPGERTALLGKTETAGLTEVVQICPPVTAADKLTAFRWADAFVYPSYYEGMPMAVIEAMACGLPVVASKVGGLPDLVSNGINGWLVEAGHPDQIADALYRLADSEALCRVMQRQSYQRAVEDFDFEKRVTQLVDIYASILEPKRVEDAQPV